MLSVEMSTKLFNASDANSSVNQAHSVGDVNLVLIKPCSINQVIQYMLSFTMFTKLTLLGID